MPCIFYRYDYHYHSNILVIDRQSTTLNELKEMIMTKEGLDMSKFDLQVINEHTNEEYTDGKTLIYQDSFVIIYYILAEDATPLDLSRASKSSEMSPPLLISRVGKTVRDKKKMKQRRPRIGSKLNVKPSPSQDRPCRERRKRTVPKWAKANELLLDLLCPICNELMVDATVTPCCGNSFCNGCVRSLLLKSGDGTCFDCNKSISPDDLVPYPALRWIIMNWRNIL